MLLDSGQIVDLRPGRHPVDPWRAAAQIVELEHVSDGCVVNVATVFLVSSECPFRCVFCDLWKNTLESATPPGATATQIVDALQRLRDEHPDRPAAQIKLYNSGNFFDARAIPPGDWPEIARLVRRFETVIVENHPRLCGDQVLQFRDLIAPATLEVAMGLETIHPDVLPRLNKRMTLDDFSTAAKFLQRGGVSLRTFILLQPPYMKAEESVDWAMRSLDFAFDAGAGCCAVIPTREGNGALERLRETGHFQRPRLSALEAVMERAIPASRGRVFADLWDAEKFAGCSFCARARIERLQAINLTQRPLSPVICGHCDGA